MLVCAGEVGLFCLCMGGLMNYRCAADAIPALRWALVFMCYRIRDYRRSPLFLAHVAVLKTVQS